jgi:hypothetical protein
MSAGSIHASTLRASLITEGVYKKELIAEVEKTPMNAPKKEELIAKLENAQSADQTLDDERNAIFEDTKMDVLVLSSVLGATQLTPEQKSKIYAPAPVEGSVSTDTEKKEFNQYLEEDQLIRDINEIIVGGTTDIGKLTQIKNRVQSQEKGIEKMTRIALVLARNHDLCSEAYTDSRSEYALNTCRFLALAGVLHDTIRGGYQGVYKRELSENLPVALDDSQQTLGASPHQDTRTHVAPIGAGGAAPPKKKNKAPKKKTK